MRNLRFHQLEDRIVLAGDFTNVIFVDDYALPAIGQGDGLTWETAYTSLDWALFQAQESKESTVICIKEGTYSPLFDEGFEFEGSNDLQLIGGYSDALTGTDRSQKDADAHPTLLDGHLPGGDAEQWPIQWQARRSQPFHILLFDVTGGNLMIEGLTIANGDASGESPHIRLFIEEISGGGAHIEGARSCAIHEVTFDGNTASGDGGGMYLLNCDSLTITNSDFVNNRAGNHGAAISIVGPVTNLHISNNIYLNNRASGGPDTVRILFTESKQD